MGRTSLVEHAIETGNSRPVRQALRRHPVAHLDEIDRQVDEVLRHDIAEPAASPWASNVVMVRKKDGAYRLCVDYRALNAVTLRIRTHYRTLIHVLIQWMVRPGFPHWTFAQATIIFRYANRIEIKLRL